MLDKLVGSCYELEHDRSDKTYIQFYDAFETEKGIVFQKRGRTEGFKCCESLQNRHFLDLMCSLQKQGYLSKAQWLKTREQRKPSFDLSVEGMLQSSYLKDFEPLDIEKTALIYEIIKALGYFNVEDVKVIYTMITAYGYEKEVDRIVALTQFLVELQRGTPIQDTELVEKSSHKILSFDKFFKRNNKKE